MGCDRVPSTPIQSKSDLPFEMRAMPVSPNGTSSVFWLHLTRNPSLLVGFLQCVTRHLARQIV